MSRRRRPDQGPPIPRKKFGRLLRDWRDDPDVIKLINDHLPMTSGIARAMERQYPGIDFEVEYMEMLYHAACTWDKVQGTFSYWLRMKCWSKNKNLIAGYYRWANALKRVPFDIIDERMFYRET